MTDNEVVENALEGMRRHQNKVEELIEKWVGKVCLQHGRSIPDIWFRKQWYCNRIKDLGVAEGLNSSRMRRCKTMESLTYKKYQEIENEIHFVVDGLILELLKCK